MRDRSSVPVAQAAINIFSQTPAADRELYCVFKQTAHLPQLGQLLSFAGTSRKPARLYLVRA